MPKKTTADLLNILFAELNNIAAPADLSPGAPPPLAFVTTMFPGVTVLPADFDPATLAGKTKLYTWMNSLPAVNKRYLDSGKSCPDMYKKILSAQFPPDDPEKAKAMEAAYNAALDLLDDDRVMDKFDKYKGKYVTARNAYFTACNKTGLAEAEHEEMIRQAKVAMDDAWDTWNGRGRKSQVEEALATCARYLAYTPNKVFADAQKVFEQARIEGVGYPVTCIPGTWATDPESLSWTDVVITQNSSESKTHHDVETMDAGFSAAYSSGPWHASASGEFHDQVEKLNQSASTENLAVSFQVARVEIRRDWFTSALLTYGQAVVPGQKAGSICAGSLEKAAKCDFPFLPTAFLVARNINIYNQFSSQETDFLHHAQSWGAKAEVGYGPFSLSANVSHSKDLTDEEKKEFGGCTKLTVGKDMQFIGFVNTILTPAFPAKDAPATAMTALRALGQHSLTTP